MSTSAQVVRMALRRLNVVARGEEVAPEDAADGLEILNNMIAAWATNGVRVQTDVPLPPRHKKGIIAMLAVEMAPTFNKTPSDLLLAEASEGWSALQAEYFKVPRLRHDAALTSFASQHQAWDGVSDYQDWKPKREYAVGDYVVNEGRLYQCDVAGMSAASVGPVTYDSAEIDGTVTWRFVQIL